LIVTNNQFRSNDGVLIDATFTAGSSALLLGNDFKDVIGLAVKLGPNTSKCLVVLTAPATVEDLGTGNIVIGPKQATNKQGTRTRSLLQMGKHR
jgi:hypothetical protein